MLPKESLEDKKIEEKLIPLLYLQFLNHGYLSRKSLCYSLVLGHLDKRSSR